MDKTQKKLEKTNAELQRINDGLERWHKKLSRAVAAIDKLRAERKRLLKPRTLEPEIRSLKLTAEEWHEIRNQDFSDTIGF